MVVQHNLTAMNANRQLGITTGAQAKSSEKLSSGYKINRAADDAAGLTISEKMRSQVRGLNKASDNAQDGVSLIQVAEGALSETHSILQRMNELATQAANDTNTTSDRTAVQQEINQLASEITRIASTTQFNTMNLIDGKFTGKKNSSKENTIYKVNQEATVEIAKQLRLRNISGIIVIDYIDMEEEKDRKNIMNLLEKELKKDRSKTQIMGFTKLDLLEMTRKKL